MVTHTCNPSTQENKSEGSPQVWGQPEIHSEMLAKQKERKQERKEGRKGSRIPRIPWEALQALQGPRVCVWVRVVFLRMKSRWTLILFFCTQISQQDSSIYRGTAWLEQSDILPILSISTGKPLNLAFWSYTGKPSLFHEIHSSRLRSARSRAWWEATPCHPLHGSYLPSQAHTSPKQVLPVIGCRRGTSRTPGKVTLKPSSKEQESHSWEDVS